jgi:hypothetical protein
LALTDQNLQTKILYHDFEVFAIEQAFFALTTSSIAAERIEEMEFSSA